MANHTGKYTSPEEKARRVAQAAEWLLQNPDGRYTEFVTYFKAKWDLSTKMVSIYYKEGGEKATELFDDKILLEKKRASISLMNMLRKAEESGDIKLALAIRQEVNKVLGLYQTNIDVTSGGGKIENFDLKTIIGFNGDNNTEAED